MTFLELFPEFNCKTVRRVLGSLTFLFLTFIIFAGVTKAVGSEEIWECRVTHISQTRSSAIIFCADGKRQMIVGAVKVVEKGTRVCGRGMQIMSCQ